MTDFTGSEDAGVVRLGDQCLVQTLDFFTPIVDDPWSFGAIAAANALSDVYAMGGRPLSAMNILCWPQGELPPEILGEILAGGAAKVHEAGAMLVGGHSVRDQELKYGLSVTGVVREERLWRNAGAQPGDQLILTKPLGTGILATALKRDLCPAASAEASMESMIALNRPAAEAAAEGAVHAATDITGYGLTGHALEIARASGCHLRFSLAALPALPSALALGERGCFPGGTRANERSAAASCDWHAASPGQRALINDPQTSGGLLLALPPEDAQRLMDKIPCWRVGEVVPGEAGLSFS